MHRLPRLALAIVAATAAAVSIAPPTASAVYPAPEGSTNVIQRVAVPIDDTTSEAVQMIIAMALGAAVTTVANRRRRRDAPTADPFNVPHPVALTTTDRQSTTTDILSR